MFKPVPVGDRTRYSYARINEVLPMPHLIDIQRKSYEWFMREGLCEIFHDISPIKDFTGNLELSFEGFTLGDPKYSVEECKERDASYSAPLNVNVRLLYKDTGEIKESKVFMGDFPLMTETGTFIINGAERVIVSQLVRSPGVYYNVSMDPSGKKMYGTTVIPNRGAWIEFETDVNDVIYARVDRTRKLPATVLLRALGLSSNAEILALFGEHPSVLATLERDATTNREEALIEIYKKLRPGEPPTLENSTQLIEATFFDNKRYDLASVGRYKLNKKLGWRRRLLDKVLDAPLVDTSTGEIILPAGTRIDDKAIDIIEQSEIFSGVGLKEVFIRVKEQVLKLICTADIPEKHRTVTVEDVLASFGYLLNLMDGLGTGDDIDHLGNRRVRSVGELLQNQFRIGLARMERVVKERMTIQDVDVITPQALINIRPVVAAIKEFFGSSQLSQFMDQNNPLAELTHKRRLSALGPGGLSRERAGYEVRDVHHSHYGRMCPIETPEGPNIGLIGSLSTFAIINKYGFMETPYRKVDKEEGRVTDEIVYLTADEEDEYICAQANEPLDENGYFLGERVTARYLNEVLSLPPNQVDYMDVSPKQVVSIATALIPFLENDDANRALMGANMQRQAVPLLCTQSPVVGTGMEYKVAVDSGVCVLAKRAGIVERVVGNEIRVRAEDGSVDVYELLKFKRSNQGTCVNQRPIVNKGDKVVEKQVLADGPATDHGELALGHNVIVAYMPWEGYNYEDAILLSEDLVKADIFTSIHIEEYDCDARDTKLGQEEITRDIPNVSEEALKDLDERGIIRIGAEVRPGDILVGKVTPKGETELTAEERLLRAIFGEKAREVRDTSLKVPHGAYGIVVGVKVFTRENGDELAPGVNKNVRIYIAQKRKISVGDKMAGRHGNKGVVSRVLPVEDMPFLPNGRPLDIVLNPLGVPSRMNIGQVLEIHLSLAAKVLGFNVATPIFDGANENDIMDTLDMANAYANHPFDDEELAKEKADAEANGEEYPEDMTTFTAEYKDLLRDDVFQFLSDNRDHRAEWKGVPIGRDGKVRLRDGRTGEYFDSPVTIGFMHYLKLHHLVDDKIHARSTGPYSLVTQQPLGGKAQFGGQRFGEMEVWALEAYGASYTLQEILTVKSDDVVGRVKTYEAIIKGENIPEPGIPESFKVLLKELQSLALDVRVLDQDNNEVQLLESSEYEVTDFKKVLDDGGYKRNSRDEENELKNAGYHAEKQGDDGEATMEELGSEDDDDFDFGDFEDDFDDYGDGNREE